MTSSSPDSFPTRSRLHVGLSVRDVERSARFYAALLGTGATKRRER